MFLLKPFWSIFIRKTTVILTNAYHDYHELIVNFAVITADILLLIVNVITWKHFELSSLKITRIQECVPRRLMCDRRLDHAVQDSRARTALWSRNSSRNRITTPTYYSHVPCRTFPRAPSTPGLVEDEIPPSAWGATSFATSSYIKALWILGVTSWQKHR